MGGNPFGPAGTGKTESVKALGAQLGRFVLVFNCDESFDYSAMGRLFAGLCQVWCYRCFDCMLAPCLVLLWTGVCVLVVVYYRQYRLPRASVHQRRVANMSIGLLDIIPPLEGGYMV